MYSSRDQLILGLLAIQNGLINREQLVSAFSSWLGNSNKPLTDYLLEAQSLTREDVVLLERLAQRIESKEAWIEQTTALIPEAKFVAKDLEGLAFPDAELTQSLVTILQSPPITSRSEAITGAALPESDEVGKKIGPYKLLQPIGSGGMGTVWMAEQEQPVRRRVAIKLIKAGLDNRQIVARFEAERQALSMMDHPSIARVLDMGSTAAGQPYFVMELVHGIPFTEYCDKNRLSLRERLELFVPVCHAIQHAHQKGIIHRDLKPSNILVAQYDGKPVPKVIDFGLAKATEIQNRLTDKTMFTEFGQVVGTIQYMSPEQAEMNSIDVDTRTDVYSLGVMLYELLTGSTPIDRETMRREAILKVLQSIREVEPPRPSARLSSASKEAVGSISEQRRIDPRKLQSLLRGESDWIVMKALEKNRNRRYSSANDLATDVENYLRGDVVFARPPSTIYLILKYVRRHKGLVASLASIVTLLIAGLFTISWFATNENRQRKLADEEREVAEAALARSNYFLANFRWNESRFGDAISLLHSIPKRFRDFEWYFDVKRFLGSHVTLYGHRFDVRSVAFSPDGTRIVTGSGDKTVKLWDAVTGSELRTLHGHTDRLTSVAFSPDGTRIVSGSGDKTLKLWDAATGGEVWTLQGHTDSVDSVAFSPDGTRIVSASGDKTLRLWDAATGSELRTLLGHTDRVSDVAFSPDGMQIVSGSVDKTLKLWDAATGIELRSLQGHINQLSAVAFSPDGTRIASGCLNGELKLWDPETGNELHSLKGHDREIFGLAFSPDGTQVVAAGGKFTLKIWDVARGSEVQTLMGHTDYVSSLAFSPDGTRIASGSWDGTLKLWDTGAASKLRTLDAKRPEVETLAFSPDGTRIVSGGWDKAIRLWDTATKSELRTLQGHVGAVRSVAFSPDGTRIVSGSQDKTLKLWDAATGRELRTLEGHTNSVVSVAFSPDGNRMISGSWDATLKLWDAVTGSELRTLQGHTASVYCVAYSPDGARLASGGGNGELKLWDASNGKELRTLRGHTNAVDSVAFSPDGTRIVSGCSETLKMWDADTSRELFTLLGHKTRQKKCVAFSPGGTRIVSGSDNGELKLWDAKTGSELQSLQGHIGLIGSVAFGPDGTRIASADFCDPLKLWDAATEVEVQRLQGHTTIVTCVAISKDGTRIASGSRNGELKLWDAKTGAELRTIAGHAAGLGGVTFSHDGTWIATGSTDGELKILDVATGGELRTYPGLTEAIWRVAFSLDGTKIISVSYGGKVVVFDIKSGTILETGDSTLDEIFSNCSTDGRWLVTGSGNTVLLVDLEFKNIPREKAYREYHARPKPWWHHEKASAAEESQNWFAAVFHRAWLVKCEPDSNEHKRALKSAYEKLLGQEQSENQKPASLFPRVLKEVIEWNVTVTS